MASFRGKWDVAVTYDVGMHAGDDIVYCVLKGHHVIGIEANPPLCEIARRRFTDRLGKDLQTINVGTA